MQLALLAWVQLIEEPSLTILRALSTLLHRSNVLVAVKQYVYLLGQNESDTAFLANVIAAEIDATSMCSLLPLPLPFSLLLSHTAACGGGATGNAFALFRETTAPSLLLSTYLHTVGSEYLTSTLEPILSQVVSRGLTCDNQQVRH
jgi:hypothetical protein